MICDDYTIEEALAEDIIVTDFGTVPLAEATKEQLIGVLKSQSLAVRELEEEIDRLEEALEIAKNKIADMAIASPSRDLRPIPGANVQSREPG